MRSTAARFALFVAVALLVVTVVIVTRPDDGVARPDRDGVLEITMLNYRFSDTELEAQADTPVTFRFVNLDDVTHHVSMGRGLAEEGDRVVGFEEDLLSVSPFEVRPTSALVELPEPYVGTTIEVRGGTTVDATITFPDTVAGEWHVGCFTGRGCHFRAGLDAVLTIEPS